MSVSLGNRNVAMEPEREKSEKGITVKRIWGDQKHGLRAGETYFISGKDYRARVVIAFQENLVPQGHVPVTLSPDELFEEEEYCEVEFIPMGKILGGPHRRNHINGDGV